MKKTITATLFSSAAIVALSTIFIQDGASGVTFAYQDEKATIKKEEIKTAIIKEATNGVVSDVKADAEAKSVKKVPTKKTSVVSSNRSFNATAYCLRGRTASGAMVRRGIVAADPRILPLGTRIQLSAGGYSGTYLVADTGGAIKGRILDIWVAGCGEAMRFGRRRVSVTVLGRS